ncbi:MAG: hypothetical protein HZB73_00605 [Nitrosarchaeum sp.]|nr:hypothetical protein [Nitrosarchaeum sp.]
MTKWMCHICLTKSEIKKLDGLHLCISCYDKVLELQKTEPYKMTKEQTAGGIKNEL